MVNYQNGKIYGIRSEQTNKIYIGSTAKKRLSDRKNSHLCLFKLWQAGSYHTNVSSFQILAFDDAKFYLIENYPCNSRDELRQREQYWIEQNRDVCVNEYRAFITPEEKILRNNAYDRRYHQEHRVEANAKASIRSSRIIQCACGTSYRAGHKSRHLSTTKHIINFILA